MTTIDMHFVQGLTLAERAALVTGRIFGTPPRCRASSG